MSMKTPRTLWLLIALLGLAGAALFVFLLLRHGLPDIAAAVAAAGWGLAAVVLFHLVPLFFDVLAWRALIPPESRLPFRQLFGIRWIGDSVSAMLPVAQVGGEVVRVRLAATRGMPLSIAAATVLVGMTVSVATQIVFTLSGLALLIALTGRSNLTAYTLAASLLGVAAVAGFYAVQRVGIFRILGALVARITRSEHWNGLIQRGQSLDRDLRTLYARLRALAASGLWNMANWATGAIEVWIALRALGVPAGYAHAYILESMSQGLRSVMFLVPGALGVQEGGYLVVGLLLGIPPRTALALALIRRVRELAFGIPGVLAWQWIEGARWWQKGSPSSPSVTSKAP